MSATPFLTPKPPARRPPVLRPFMLHEHREIAALCDTLLEASRADDREGVADAWTALERMLSEHLVFEEQHLFPLLATQNPREVEALQKEHAVLRDQLSSLSVEIDLHVVRLPSLDKLVALLRAHAMREDAVLYRWADAQLGPAGASA